MNVSRGSAGSRTGMSFAVTGPLGEGWIEAAGSEEDGGVRFERLVVQVGTEEIDLLREPAGDV